MPTDRPTAEELVEAVREFLREQVAPNTEGQLSYHARVAANALAMVARELGQAGAMADAERARLAALLGHDGEPVALNRELAAKIRSGAMDGRRAEVLDHLRRTSADKLRLANPRYLRPDKSDARQ
ncbi:MAG TPA: DUF6285 domain-containing protein [Alphaproteobacteria bacterium]|jgi:hypothetical protein|nr:DUF6285 domain-containing protein [Alphaproteobacteria bacterium]